jgi:DNA-directed RNA polymerase subunit omega
MPTRTTLMEPPIEQLIDRIGTRFGLVVVAAKRARQINAYYGSLGEGYGRVVPPQVTTVSDRPLSIAFAEIAAGKVVARRDERPRPIGEAAEATEPEPSAFEPEGA